MSKSTHIESTIARLAALKLAPRSPEAAKELAKALASKNSYLAERAAAFIAEFNLADLTPELVKAFDYFLSAGTDSGYSTRTELAKALHEINADVPAVYLAGLHLFGTAPPHGYDPAAALRGTCAMALVRFGHPRALIEATDLLADGSYATIPAQLGAIRALAHSCEPAAMLVLRLKLQIGNNESEVVCECLSALMQLDAVNSLPLVAAYLNDRDEAIAESAALALGESRRREAMDALLAHYAQLPDAESRRPVLLAISLTRLPDAAPFLVEQLESADLKTAGHALEALRIYRVDDVLVAKIGDAVRKRGNETLSAQFDKLFR